ncbi:hypothetical protein MC885_014646 [Smutsia gigantea]|nr:hypothetical protein MC885_014646 [Smutsia gigantea]
MDSKTALSSNFSRASLGYPCDINALERDSPGQALGSWTSPLRHSPPSFSFSTDSQGESGTAPQCSSLWC